MSSQQVGAPGPAAGNVDGTAPNRPALTLQSVIGTVARMAFMPDHLNCLMLILGLSSEANAGSWGNNQQKAQTQDPASFIAPKFSKGSLVDMYLFVNEQWRVPQGRYNMADLLWSEVSSDKLEFREPILVLRLIHAMGLIFI
eukprot:scaffold59671_cov20-Tisochrysis_lutea.AAC.4